MKQTNTQISDEKLDQILRNNDMRETNRIEGEKLDRTLEQSRELNGKLESNISEGRMVYAELKDAVGAVKELQITLKLTPERQAVLDKAQDRILDKERQLLSVHEKRNRDLIDSMQDDMTNKIRNSGGVWLSKRVFWWVFGINAGAWIFTLTFILTKIILRIQGG